MEMSIPSQVNKALHILEEAGYEAYAVGGCVRDEVLGKEPEDWDLCTSARPDEIMEVFQDYKTIPTGLQHGTVTVVINYMHLEITTFRIDGSYTDNRHPDQVNFTTSLEEDLARRDFTTNAMAYNPSAGLVDPFNGRGDLKRKKIRCVGDATKRFNEDALRIMRALRFASVLGFDIEENTSKAMHQESGLLLNIAAERINVELSKFIVGEKAEELLMEYRDVFAQIIPEIKPCFDFDQKNFHHIYDVWQHIVKSVGAAPKDEIIRYTLLLHDIGKPKTFTMDDSGVGHFYGHAAESEELERNILNYLKFDNERKHHILKLVKYHDYPITGERKQMKRLMNKLGSEDAARLLEVKRADALGQAPAFHSMRLALIEAAALELRDIAAENQCFSLKDLEINGRDLIEAGVKPGPAVGAALKEALEAVIEEEIPNKKYEILRFLDKSNKK